MFLYSVLVLRHVLILILADFLPFGFSIGHFLHGLVSSRPELGYFATVELGLREVEKRWPDSSKIGSKDVLKLERQ